MENEAMDAFYGVLGRIEVQPHQAVLRFYPFVFSTDIAATDVFCVRFDQPQFTRNDLKIWEGREIDISVSARSMTVDDVFNDMSGSFAADHITVERLPYDITDCLQRITDIESHYRDLDADFIAMRMRVDRTISLAHELVRRAEIKAAASDSLNAKQKPAIAVLYRMIAELERDD